MGNTVNITFELLDTDKSGVVAWLWQESPFQEFDLTQDGARTFRRSISGVETGQTLSFACKFAYAGGLSVTNYIQYVVGSNCSGTVPEENNNQEEEEEEEEENEQETPPVENTLCSGQSTEATQGSFSSGFTYEFIPSSSQLTVRFALLDNQNDVNAYLWQENPFRESGMNSIGNNRFEATIDLAQGESTQFACKFAFAGGLAVTKYFTYTMGQSCGQSSTENDADQDGVWDDFDQCPNTAAGVTVNQNGCALFYLPPANFSISKIEKCEDNNSLVIAVNETDYTYNVAVRGATTINESFTGERIRFDDLSSGMYSICITVEGVPQSEFERCYNVEIEAIQPLSISAFKDIKNEVINFDLRERHLLYHTQSNKYTDY